MRAHIDNPDTLLRPGMLMTVKLTTASRDALMVPETALVQRGMETFVYAVTDGRALMTTIDLGIRRDGWAEARAGIMPGQEVVAEGVMKVRDGGPVRRAGQVGANPGVPSPRANVGSGS